MQEECVSFTTSMKRFESNLVPESVENFFIIDQSTVIFNADLVESTTMTRMDATSVWMRLNLRDGTSIEKQFTLTHHIVH